MRIGLVSYGLNRSPTGIGQYTHRLLENLINEGWPPIVLQSGGWPNGWSYSNLSTVHLTGSWLLPALLSLGQVQIGWQAHHLGLNLVHDPTGTIPLGLCLAKRVVTICDTIPYVYPEVSTTLDHLIYHHWLPFVVKGLDAVITISQHSKKDLEKHLQISGEKTTVTPLAADSKFKILPDSEIVPVLERSGVERPYILFVGSISPRKNLLSLLKAYAQFSQWSSKWQLVIVGAHNYWKSSPVAEMVEKLGLESQVRFTGYIPDEDLPALYNGADLFCFPSLYEGFGLPVLEAMACGTPVVASNSSSLPEVAGDAALLVDPYDVDAIAETMRQVLEDGDLAQSLRKKGLENAKQYTWERTAQETIAVYQKVLGESI